MKSKLWCRSVQSFNLIPDRASFIPGQPVRYGETVQRIWIAPYEDTEGNYHQDSFMYSVMKGGHWKGNPVKNIPFILKNEVQRNIKKCLVKLLRNATEKIGEKM